MEKYFYKQYKDFIYSLKKFICIICHAKIVDYASKMLYSLEILKIFLFYCLYYMYFYVQSFELIVPFSILRHVSLSKSKNINTFFCYVHKNQNKAIFCIN